MSFIRRLFGGRGDGEVERDVAVPDAAREPTPSAELGPQTYLEFVGGSAAKFYAAVLEQDDGGTWRVAFNFGRIGYPREWAYKVDGVAEPRARRVYADLVGEKLRKGYEVRPWPASLALPSGERVNEAADAPRSSVRGIYVSAVAGQLPTDGGSIAGVDLKPGRLLSAEASGGPRGEGPVLWVTEQPVPDVVERWTALARAFPQTGLWPLVVDPSQGIDGMTEVLMDIPRSTGADPFQLLRRWWHENVGEDDEVDEGVV
ncbi:MAG TPA: WGR domain-containing protein, partial [Candidatus Limnocylindrales bacterium]|nr:WGR domain-containing protein [Candidatus Limnocylindrales bacterium]